MDIIDVDYRISWDGEERYHPEFHITVRMSDGSEEDIACAPEMTFQGQIEAQAFAEGFVLELLGE